MDSLAALQYPEIYNLFLASFMRRLVIFFVLAIISSNSLAEDRALSEVIREKFAQQGELLHEVRIVEFKGRVVLIGYVYDTNATAYAIRLAGNTPGVSEVINHIQYFQKRMFYMFNYLKYENDIMANIKQNKGINPSNYSIAVNQQGVFVIGQAANENEKLAVLKIIQGIMPKATIYDYIK